MIVKNRFVSNKIVKIIESITFDEYKNYKNIFQPIHVSDSHFNLNKYLHTWR